MDCDNPSRSTGCDFDFELDRDMVNVDLVRDIGLKDIDLAWMLSLADLFRSRMLMTPLMGTGRWGSAKARARRGMIQRPLDSRGLAKGCRTVGERKESAQSREIARGIKDAKSWIMIAPSMGGGNDPRRPLISDRHLSPPFPQAVKIFGYYRSPIASGVFTSSRPPIPRPNPSVLILISCPFARRPCNEVAPSLGLGLFGMYARSGDRRMGEEMEMGTVALKGDVDGFFGIVKECGVSTSVFSPLRKGQKEMRRARLSSCRPVSLHSLRTFSHVDTSHLHAEEINKLVVKQF